jgi:hypothetical protein
LLFTDAFIYMIDIKLILLFIMCFTAYQNCS